MKKMIVTSALVVSLMSAGSMAYAKHDGGDRRNGPPIEMMTRVLDLSQEQKAAITNLRDARKEAVAADRARLKELRKAMRQEPFVAEQARVVSAEIGEILGRLSYQRAATRAQVMDLLNDEQKEKMKALSEHRKHRGEGRGHRS